MLTPEQLRFLFEYTQWANGKILDACAELSPEQFTREMGSSFSSVRDTLVHLYGAMWIWRERFLGHSPAKLPAGGTIAGFASARAKLEEIDQEYLGYLSGLTPADLERVLEYKNLAGEQVSNTVGQALHQLTNHATYHRGQIVTLLRQLGAKAPSTDLIIYYRKMGKGARA